MRLCTCENIYCQLCYNWHQWGTNDYTTLQTRKTTSAGTEPAMEGRRLPALLAGSEPPERKQTSTA